MNKTIPKLLILTLTFVLMQCSMVREYQARSLLKKCHFELKEVQFQSLSLGNEIQMNGKKLQIRDLGKSVNQYLSQLQKGNLFPANSKLSLNLILEMKNTSDQWVILDSLNAEALFAKKYAVQILHSKKEKVEAKQMANIKLNLQIPLTTQVFSLLETDSIQFKGTLWAKMNLAGKDRIFPIEFKKKEKFPSKMIRDKIDQEKNKWLRKIKMTLLKNLFS